MSRTYFIDPRKRDWVEPTLRELRRHDGKITEELKRSQERIPKIEIDERTKAEILRLAFQAKAGDVEALNELLYQVKSNENIALFAINTPDIAVLENTKINLGSVAYAATFHVSCAFDLLYNHPELMGIKDFHGWSVAEGVVNHEQCALELIKNYKDFALIRDNFGIPVASYAAINHKRVAVEILNNHKDLLILEDNAGTTVREAIEKEWIL